MSGFFTVPNDGFDNPELSPLAKLVWLALIRVGRNKTGVSWVEYATLMEKTGIRSTNTIKKCLDELVRAGYITYEKRKGKPGLNTSYRYTVHVRRGTDYTLPSLTRCDAVPHELRDGVSRGEQELDEVLDEVQEELLTGNEVPGRIEDASASRLHQEEGREEEPITDEQWRTLYGILNDTSWIMPGGIAAEAEAALENITTTKGEARDLIRRLSDARTAYRNCPECGVVEDEKDDQPSWIITTKNDEAWL